VARAAPSASVTSAALAVLGTAHGKGREPLADAGASAFGALGAAAVLAGTDEFLELLAARLALEFIQRHSCAPWHCPPAIFYSFFPPASRKERAEKNARNGIESIIGGFFPSPGGMPTPLCAWACERLRRRTCPGKRRPGHATP
jgi:hypothetical protein